MWRLIGTDLKSIGDDIAVRDHHTFLDALVSRYRRCRSTHSQASQRFH